MKERLRRLCVWRNIRDSHTWYLSVLISWVYCKSNRRDMDISSIKFPSVNAICFFGAGAALGQFCWNTELEAEICMQEGREGGRIRQRRWATEQSRSWDSLAYVVLCLDKGTESFYPCISQSLIVSCPWRGGLNPQEETLSCPGQCSEWGSVVSHLHPSEVKGMNESWSWEEADRYLTAVSWLFTY